MKRLSTGKIFALCMGDFAKGLINGIITTYLLTFFIPTSSKTTLPQFFLNAALIMAAIRGVGTIVDAITDPWVANLTDKCTHKLGRRIPCMRWNAIPYGMCCLLVFFPPVNGTSYINALWVGVLLILYYLFSIRQARQAGCKVMMYGCGIGPVKRKKNRTLAARVIDRNVDCITLRVNEERMYDYE